MPSTLLIPRISVITVVYNRVHTIDQALDSVQAQTWPAIEHIVIDGASRDGTRERLMARAEQLAVFVSEPDGGIYDALNKGLARATGDIVGFMHSDDFYAHDQVLARVAAAFADPAVQAVYGDLEYVAKDDVTRIIRHWKAGECTLDKLTWGWMPPHPTLYLRRSVYESWGGFDTRFRIAADYDSILRYFVRARINVAYVPEVLVKMRVGGESNRSLARVWRKMYEDYLALRRNGVGGFGALLWKSLSKLPQFFRR